MGFPASGISSDGGADRGMGQLHTRPASVHAVSVQPAAGGGNLLQDGRRLVLLRPVPGADAYSDALTFLASRAGEIHEAPSRIDTGAARSFVLSRAHVVRYSQRPPCTAMP